MHKKIIAEKLETWYNTNSAAELLNSICDSKLVRTIKDFQDNF